MIKLFLTANLFNIFYFSIEIHHHHIKLKEKIVEDILVTGATSYIGKHCIALLIEKGYKVRTTIRDIKRADQVKI